MWDGLTVYKDIACMINIGKFLDYLRANNAYDNTRIVIVADHGGVIKKIILIK